MTMQELKDVAVDLVTTLTAGMNPDHNDHLLNPSFLVTDFELHETEGFDPAEPEAEEK